MDVHSTSGWRNNATRADPRGASRSATGTLPCVPGQGGGVEVRTRLLSRAPSLGSGLREAKLLMIHPDWADLASEMDFHGGLREREGFDFSL